MQRALLDGLRALDRWKIIERELAEIRRSLDAAAEAIYNGTLYDPGGTRDERGKRVRCNPVCTPGNAGLGCGSSSSGTNLG
jgi:hypothetical protein